MKRGDIKADHDIMWLESMASDETDKLVMNFEDLRLSKEQWAIRGLWLTVQFCEDIAGVLKRKELPRNF